MFIMYLYVTILFILLIKVDATSVEEITEAQNEEFSEEERKPNIIMIVADDLGFNDVPWHNKEVVAPNIAKLAKEGVILEQSYVQPICSPTRAALLSGTYPFATGRQAGVIWPTMPTGLTLNATVIPQLLKPLGYETHAVGKWHLGFCNWKYTPTERGFDTFRGYYTGAEHYYTHVRNYGKSVNENEASKHYPNDTNQHFGQLQSEKERMAWDIPNGYDFRKNKDPYFDAYGNYSTYEFASHLEDVLHSSNQSTPKFIYMAFQSVHAPLEVPDNYTEPYMHIKNKSRRKYLGMVTAMDEAIGRIVAALKDTNHYNNSVIVFTTDNGGPTIWGGNNWPLRGNKTTLWEGGTRGAAFIHSPLLPNPGTVSNNLIHVTDWMSTFVTLAGGKTPKKVDSISQWDALMGNSKPPRKELVYNINVHKSELQAGIRVGDFKLLVGDPGKGDWTPPPEVDQEGEPFVFPFNDTTEMDTWDFEDHMRFLRKMKKKCKHKHCLSSVLSKYKAVKTTKHDDTVWSKILQTVKKYVINLRQTIEKFGFSVTGVKKYNKKLKQKRKHVKNLFNNRTLSDFDTVEEILKLPIKYRLYNLKDDPEERNNLAKSKPGIVVTLMRRLMTYKDRYVTPDEPAEDPKGNSKFWGGVWSPGWC